MSLKPPSLWIEQRGLQHRVYWRNRVPGLPVRSYLPFYGRAEAEQFVGMAGLLGLDTARQVLEADGPHAATVLLQEALTERHLAPADRTAAPLAPAGSPLSAAPAGASSDPRLTGVTFRRLWQTFLDRHRNIAEGDPRALRELRGVSPAAVVRRHRHRLDPAHGAAPHQRRPARRPTRGHRSPACMPRPPAPPALGTQ